MKTYENGLISIVIPVYNVENYLKQCLDSVISQTYRKIEIILADDGSTDRSGKICDEYAKSDSRIKVIHKTNGGLSDARNAGLKIASGEYIGFVDSDDFIEKDMYEILLGLMQKYGVSLSCARFDQFGENTRFDPPLASGEIVKIKGEELLKNIISENLNRYATLSVWDRLYKREIIEKLKFPVGKCYEDVVFSTIAILNCPYCVYINKPLYHYRIRKGSITERGIYYGFDDKLISDRLPLQKEQILYLENKGFFQLSNLAKSHYYQEMLLFYALCKDNSQKEKIRNALCEWKISRKDCLKLDCSFRRKLLITVKNLFPEFFIQYYKYKNNIP